MSDERLMLELDETYLERAIAEHCRDGETDSLAAIATMADRIQKNRTRFERLFPNRPIGLNDIILQLSAVLAKTGFTD